MRLTTMTEQTPQTGTQSDRHDTERRGRPAPSWLAPAGIFLLGIAAIAGLVFLAGRQSLEPTPAPSAGTGQAGMAASTAGTQARGGQARGRQSAGGQTRPAEAQGAASAGAASPGARQAQATPQAPATPTFDTVRVDAGGNAVIAGTAAPGARVTVTASGRPVGTVTADKSGEFAFVTTTPLPPGAAAIGLTETLADGTHRKSERTVAISVPNRPAEGALAVLTGTGNTPSKVLSGQGPKPGTLGVSSVDYNASGHAVIAGTAPPGSHVKLMLGGNPIGTARTDHNGRWRISTEHLPSTPGTFTVETVQNDGKVEQSMQTAYAPRQFASLPPGQIVVKRGECLWLIARRAYGTGVDYTLIYRANERRISNPDLIYPGQTLTVPKPHAVRG